LRSPRWAATRSQQALHSVTLPLALVSRSLPQGILALCCGRVPIGPRPLPITGRSSCGRAMRPALLVQSPIIPRNVSQDHLASPSSSSPVAGRTRERHGFVKCSSKLCTTSVDRHDLELASRFGRERRWPRDFAPDRACPRRCRAPASSIPRQRLAQPALTARASLGEESIAFLERLSGP
jgi:hypothetical protein